MRTVAISACGIAFVILATLPSLVFAAKDECRDVLKDGTRATSLYSSRFEYRRLLESRLLNLTFDEAKRDTSFTGTIPIGEIVLGVGFDESTYNSYKSYLQQEVASRVDVSRSLDIMLSTGDPEILKAWTDCMNGKVGLISYFSDVHATSAVLNLEWRAAAGVPKVRLKQDFKLPKEVRIVAGKDILGGKEWLVAGTKHQIKFEFADAKVPLALTMNVEKEGGGLAGADSAYVPARLELFRQARPYQFATARCDKSPFLGVDTRHHSGNSYRATFCSDVANGWRFSRGALQVTAIVAIPGEIPGTFANHQEYWNGDFQVAIVLGCSNSSGTDIQCQAMAALQEERFRWKTRQDVQVFEAVGAIK